MMAHGMSENIVEQAALSWLEEIGYFVHAGHDVSPNGEMPLRDSYGTLSLRHGCARRFVGLMTSCRRT